MPPPAFQIPRLQVCADARIETSPVQNVGLLASCWPLCPIATIHRLSLRIQRRFIGRQNC